MIALPKIISKSPEVLSGVPVFSGTRVPIKNLMDYLRAGDTIETFLDDFPSVQRNQVDALLNFAEAVLLEQADARIA